MSPSLQSETVQRSLEGFLVEKEVKSEEQAVQLQQLQGDLSRVVLMLESLTIPKKPTNLTSELVPVNEDVTGVMSASNLLEVKHPEISLSRFWKMVVQSLATHVSNFSNLNQENICRYF